MGETQKIVGLVDGKESLQQTEDKARLKDVWKKVITLVKKIPGRNKHNLSGKMVVRNLKKKKERVSGQRKKCDTVSGQRMEKGW